MKPEVPNENDWEDYALDLDQKYAHDIFYGKTNSEMMSKYKRNVTHRASDLRFMPKIPFQYYILGFRDYVINAKSDEMDSADAASCFLGLVEEKLKSNAEYILPVMGEILPDLIFIASNQDSYQAPARIYGDFSETLENITSLYTKHILDGYKIAFQQRRRK